MDSRAQPGGPVTRPLDSEGDLDDMANQREIRRQELDDDERRRREAIRRDIDGCRECDDYGRLDDLTDCPMHPNFRQGVRA